MRTLIKLLLGTLSLILVIAIALVVAIVTLDPNDHKDWIIGKVKEETGRALTLEGNINLTYYPWLGLEANGITLGNAPGFGNQPFLHIDFIKLRVKSTPLLRNQFEIDTVQIHGAAVNLAKNTEGITNWADLTGGKKKEAEALPLAGLILGGVDIQNAQLAWHDYSKGTHYQISKLDIKTGELIYGEPIELSLSFDAKSNKPTLDGQAALTGTIVYDLDTDIASVRPLQLTGMLRGNNIPDGETAIALSAPIDVNISKGVATINELLLEALGIHVTGKLGSSKLFTPTPSLLLALDIQGSDLAQVFKIFEVEPLASQLNQLSDRSFVVNTVIDVDLERGDIDISRFSSDLLGAAIQGEMKARNIQSQTPSFQGVLNATGPDLPALLQVAGQFEGGDKSNLTIYGKRFTALPSDQKRFSVDTKFNADLKSGDIDVSALSLKALGINVSGDLKASDMQSKQGTVEGSLMMTGSTLSGVLNALEQPDLAGVLQEITFKTNISGNRKAINLKPLQLQATLAGKQIPNSPVDLDVNATTHVNLDAEKLNVDNFSVKGLGLNIHGKLNVDNILQKQPEFAGQLQIDPFNLRKLVQQLNQKLPLTADKSVFNQLALTTQFTGSTNRVGLSDLDLGLDESRLTGNLSVANFKTPIIQFDLNIDNINADRYLPPEKENKKTKPVTPESAAAAAAQLPIEQLRTINTSGNMKIGRLIISNINLTNVTLGFKGKDGIIKLDPISTDLYQGHYTGKVNLNAAGKLPQLTIDTSITGIRVEPLLKDLMGKADLAGTGDFSIKLSGTGAATDAIKSSLNGQGQIKFANGIVRGVDVRKVLDQAELILESKRMIKVDKGKETHFEQLTGTFLIDSGVVTNTDLLMTAPGFKVTGDGILANLNNDTLKYNLNLAVDETSATKGEERYNLGGYKIPVRCRGKLDTPDCKPDLGEILKIALKKAGEDKVKNLLQKALGVESKVPTQPESATTGTEQQPAPADLQKEILNKALESIFN